MDLRQFIQTVITHEAAPRTVGRVEAGSSDLLTTWMCLAFAPPKGQGFWEEWFKYPDELERALDMALTKAEDCNVYFSSYLSKSPSSIKDQILCSRTIQADLDDADILTLPLQPSLLVETSPGRHQGYWFLREQLPIDVHEVLSRKLTYSIKKCDTSGWPAGRKVRVPYTFNYKYLEGPQEIKIISAPLKVYGQEDLELLQDPPPFLATAADVDFLDKLSTDGVVVGNVIGPQELFASIQHTLPPGVRTSYNVKQHDRSRALWALMCALFKAGLPREEVWWLAWNSANNKFADLKYHSERELAKDVLRAEAQVKSKVVDEREKISEARRLQGHSHDRKHHVFELVLEFMRASGDFVHTADDVCWYIRHDLGRPILLSNNSEWLGMILDIQFGLNASEQDKTYVAAGLSNWAKSLPVNGTQYALSFYDRNSNALLLHTGRKEVLKVTENDVLKGTDGSYGALFPWRVSNEPFSPRLGSGANDKWADVLFRSALGNVIGIEQDDAQALLQVWLLFLLFRSTSVARPILAFFGQPGAGKSTLFRRIYTLLYGRQKSVLGITGADNFDMAMTIDPFIVLDNVDLPEKWLPDRLAQAAANSDIPKRKLYTDGDEYVLKRQALVGITAHNPRFTREDVSDRLLLLTFKRLEHFLPEGDIIEAINNDRNSLWGGIVQDCQRVLATPQPSYADVPQFRIEDFARTGYWIASALGTQKQFTDALRSVSKGTKTLNLDEDQVLVNALKAYVERGRAGTWKTPGALWSELPLVAPDPTAFVKLYRGAVNLGKKLLVLQDSLKEVLPVEVMFDKSQSQRLWRFGVPTTNGVTNGKE